jgi:hypothetical protein
MTMSARERCPDTAEQGMVDWRNQLRYMRIASSLTFNYTYHDRSVYACCTSPPISWTSIADAGISSQVTDSKGI